jgi:hypothetical protein
MRKYKTSFEYKDVDLDDPSNYDYLPKNIRELQDLWYKEVGQALCYMDFFHPDVFPREKQIPRLVEAYGTVHDQANAGYEQHQRVNKIVKRFAEGYQSHHDNVLWYQELIFLLQDECENMC